MRWTSFYLNYYKLKKVCVCKCVQIVFMFMDLLSIAISFLPTIST